MKGSKGIFILFFCISILFSNHTWSGGSASLVTRLYSEGHPQTQENGTIQDFASFKHFMYVSWRDLDGDQVLDVFDLRDQKSPVWVTQYSFGNILGDQRNLIPDAHLKAPRDMKVQDGHLILWSDNHYKVYEPDETGRLSEVLDKDFVDGLNPNGLSRLNHHGQYASVHKRLLSDQEVVDLLVQGIPIDNLLSGYGILNLNNPLKPFFIKKTTAHGANYQTNADPLNGTLNQMPAGFSWDQDKDNLTVTTYETELSEHILDFWDSKKSQVFAGALFDNTFQEINANLLAEVNLETLQTKIVAELFTDLDLQSNWEDQILAHTFEDDFLIQLMDEYGILEKDTIKQAVQKLIRAHVTAAMNRKLSQTVYANAMKQWQNKVLVLNSDNIDTLKQDLLDVMYQEVDGDTPVAYFTQRIIAPLFGNHDYFDWTLDELVNDLTDNDAADAIDTSLDVVNTSLDNAEFIMDSAASPIGTIISIAEWLSGEDVNINMSDLNPPVCFRIPDNAKGMLELGLYEHGAQLNRNGFAFFEIMKLGQYYSGVNDYDLFELNFEDSVYNLHTDLSQEIYTKLFGQFEPLLNLNPNIEEISEEFVLGLPAESILVDLVTESILYDLKTKGVNVDLTVEAYLEGLLTDEMNTYRELQITHLITHLTDLNLNTTLLNRTSYLAKTLTTDPLTKSLQQFWNSLTEEVFGKVHLETTTFEEGIDLFFTQQIDSAQIFGGMISETMNQMVSSEFDGTAIFNWSTYWERMQRGDCMAQWETAVNGIQIGLSLIQNFDFTGTLANLNFWVERLHTALTDAYERAISYAVQKMIASLIEAVMRGSGRDYASHYAHLVGHSETFDLRNYLSTDFHHKNAFSFENKVGVLLRNVGILGPYPIQADYGEVKVALFDPDDIDNTYQEIDLGRWTHFNSWDVDEEMIVLTGRRLSGNDAETSVVIFDLKNAPAQPLVIKGSLAVRYSVIQQIKKMHGGQQVALQTETNELLILDRPQSTANLNAVNEQELIDASGASGAGGSGNNNGSGAGGASFSSGAASGGCQLNQASNQPSALVLVALVLLMVLFQIRNHIREQRVK